MEKSMRVDVIGAGIAGLAVASGLQRAGATVTVRERCPNATQNGSGLSLFTNGFTALDVLGLADPVRAVAGIPPKLPSGIRRRDGRWMARFSTAAIADLRIVERQRLHDVLLGSLRPGTVRFSSPVRGQAFSASTGARLSDADVIVAADGIRSEVRTAWPGDPGVRCAGYFAFRGITAEPVRLDALGETWGPGRRFGVAPLSDGRVYWFATYSAPRHEPPLDPARLRELFAGWHSPIEAIITATAPDAVTMLPVEELSHCPPSLHKDNVVLLGDAAHAMTPNLGQGANLALEDAATLVRLLAPHTSASRPPDADVRRALQTYQRSRRPRVAAIARRARRLGEVGQWRNPGAVWARDTSITRLPDALMNAATVRLQSWKP